MTLEKHKGERIAKRIARAGLCSRRDAEVWVREGRVKVNGSVLETPACVVTQGDRVEVDGKALGQNDATRLWLYHKPAGLVTTHKDDKGRKTVFESLPDGLPRVVSVGRLDLNTEGLLLLTNDGELSRYLELPSTGWGRQYRVRVNGSITQAKLDALKKGITIDGVQYGAIKAQLDAQKDGRNQWLQMTIWEGKNREVRRIIEAIGGRVTRLIRVSYGPFMLGKIPKSDVLEVKSEVIKSQIPKFFDGKNKGL